MNAGATYKAANLHIPLCATDFLSLLHRRITGCCDINLESHVLQVDSLKAKLLEKLEQDLDGLQINPEEASKLAEHNDSSKDEESNNQGPAKIHEVNMDYATSLCLVF